jgi:two-component system, NarL family, nitrate/nitrite response regulator NarL
MNASPSPLRIVLADDHALLVEALSLILEPLGRVVATASDGRALVEAVRQHNPDLVITDLSMPEASGFQALREIGQLPDPPPVVVLTVHADQGTLEAALNAGASGYVVKSAASTELLKAARLVMQGKTYIPGHLKAVRTQRGAVAIITDRQRGVLDGLAAGLTSREIAERLNVTERTVVFHREQLRRRLGVRSAHQMIERLRQLEELGGGEAPLPEDASG